MVLPRIGAGRDDIREEELAGQSIEELPQEQLPPCVEEHGTFMARFPLTLTKSHPYRESAPITHGHFDAQIYTIQSYSVAAVPFRWMLREFVEGNEKKGVTGKAEQYQLDYVGEREPDMRVNPAWNKQYDNWVQDGINQQIMLDTFFSAAEREESLIFFYAKRTPMVEDNRRVIIGVGRLKGIADSPIEYGYKKDRPADSMSGFLWERSLQHSIRPDFQDGFLLPYQNLIDKADVDPSIDVPSCTAFAPDEYFVDYSYGSELLPQDGAIASLLVVEKAIKAMRPHVEAPWDRFLSWIDKELNRLWQARGAFPGLGAALNAFGLPHGNLLAWYLCGDSEQPVDPWPLLEAALADSTSLPKYLQDGLGPTQCEKLQKLPAERRALLQLLSRFNLSDSQAERWYQRTVREKAGITLIDKDILENTYRVFEEDRQQLDPVAFDVVDRGLFPPETLRKDFPIPKPSLVREAIDPRRVRGVILQVLEEASNEGHTLLPQKWLIERVRERPMKPECPLDEDLLPLVIDTLSPLVERVTLRNEVFAFQLDRYVATTALIRKTVLRRSQGNQQKPHAGDHPWHELVNIAIEGNKYYAGKDESEKRAREEKTAALEMIYRSRISVLIGSAGTGKSTLLNALCQIQSIRDAGLLLLAPTGKARVRLEQASGMPGKGQTIAQFLNGLHRYDGEMRRYFMNPEASKSAVNKTLVIDECSMLTEEQLAALLDAVSGVDRLIMVGDPKQLPPIGAGRPYVDIVKQLMPENANSLFPKVVPGFAELTIIRRQDCSDAEERPDVLLANCFSGRALDAGADEIWHTVKDCPQVELVEWNHASEVQDLLLAHLVTELGLKSPDDEEGFEVSVGGTVSEFNDRNFVWFNNTSNKGPGASLKAEDWQILSPIRPTQFGVPAINRRIQQQFRNGFMKMAAKASYPRKRKIPKPAGAENIIYGDKVINIRNSGRRRVYPDKEDKYVANGDIGVVVGHRRTKTRDWKPKELEVEFSSQPGSVYKYYPSEFDSQESSPPLELAYALTVHKTQGSEFGTTFLVLPNPCRILSREMLYTALTRHRDKVVIFHQGEFRALEKYSHEEASEIAKRMTNLFVPSEPCAVQINNKMVFLDENLIYRTERGELVRSKSEWIIADKLHSAKIDYLYERPLQLDGVDRFPDFTIIDDDSGITWYWEHNGMLSDSNYRRRWERKLEAYRRADILPYEEGGGDNGTLLITEEKQGVGLDADIIQRNINAVKGT